MPKKALCITWDLQDAVPKSDWAQEKTVQIVKYFHVKVIDMYVMN